MHKGCHSAKVRYSTKSPEGWQKHSADNWRQAPVCCQLSARCPNDKWAHLPFVRQRHRYDGIAASGSKNKSRQINSAGQQENNSNKSKTKAKAKVKAAFMPHTLQAASRAKNRGIYLFISARRQKIVNTDQYWRRKREQVLAARQATASSSSSSDLR